MKTLCKDHICLEKDVTTTEQGTQTDAVYEITSMKKEGLKFLVSRIYNCESKPDGCTRKYKMCSIADQHFFFEPGEEDRASFNFDPTGEECTDADCTKGREYKIRQKLYYDRNCYDFDEGEDGEYDKYQDNGHELDFLLFKAMKYHIKIQRRNRNEHGRWDDEIVNYERTSAKLSTSKKLKVVDKMTQYGEDNPDEDFFEGAKYMAIKILERETSTQRLECYFEADRDWMGYEYGEKGDCRNKKCDDSENCNGAECRKVYCDNCGPLWTIANGRLIIAETNGGCDCRCALLPPGFAVGEAYKKLECDCDRCNCLENIWIASENYQKYLVWRSKTPGELVEELKKKIIFLRKDRYLP